MYLSIYFVCIIYILVGRALWLIDTYIYLEMWLSRVISIYVYVYLYQPCIIYTYGLVLKYNCLSLKYNAYMCILYLAKLAACNFKPYFYKYGLYNNLGYHNLYLGIFMMLNSIYFYHCMLVDTYISISLYVWQLSNLLVSKPSYITCHSLSCHAYVNFNAFLSNTCNMGHVLLKSTYA